MHMDGTATQSRVCIKIHLKKKATGGILEGRSNEVEAYFALEFDRVPTIFKQSPLERERGNLSLREELFCDSALYIRIARPLLSKISLSARTNIPCLGRQVK
uniref:Uncharacterized protein n=1 Tax=Photinus pyralis TaxID=7054 RepID=A0A1Y1KSC8_PHOPY